VANDLTFQQLVDELPAGSTFAAADAAPVPAAGVYINVSTLTGDVIDTPADTGVVETLLKLVQGAAAGQETINDGAAAGARLAAFPPATFGAPTLDATTGNYFATIIASVTAQAPLNVDSTVGIPLLSFSEDQSSECLLHKGYKL